MLRLIGILTAAALLAGCGEVVTIQPGEVGKQLTSRGLDSEIRAPGTVRLDSCGGAGAICPKVVRMATGRTGTDVAIDSIFLPKSNVDVTNVKVGLQYRVRPDDASINKVFAEVRPQPDERNDRQMFISSVMIWDTFGRRVVPAVVVDAMKDLVVEQAMNTGSELSGTVLSAVQRALKDSPIEVTQLEVVNTDVPQAVLEAKRALFAIDDEKVRQIKQLETGMAIEERRQAFQVARARNDLMVAKSMGMSVGQYWCLKTAERLADAADDKGSTVVINGDCGLSQGAGLPLQVLPLDKEAPTP
jgi:hypothetical protein